MNKIKPKFEIGDLIVEKNSKYYDDFFVCRITDLNYDKEFEFDFSDMDTYLYMAEVIYLGGETNGLEIGDIIIFEESEITTIEDYLNEKPITIQEYVQYLQRW